MMDHMMGGMGPWMVLWVVVSLAVLALASAGTVWLTRALTTGVHTPSLQPPVIDAAQAELRRRYAAGEIDREQYLQGKVDLES